MESTKTALNLRVRLAVILVIGLVSIGLMVGASSYAHAQTASGDLVLNSGLCDSANVGTKVQPILFVPSNLTADSSYLSAIDDAFGRISIWYETQLDGRTFYCVPAVEVVGRYELKHYCPKTIATTQCIQIPGEVGADPGDIYAVLSDLGTQGYPVQKDTILAVFWVGGYGYAGGLKTSYRSGWAAFGDWALDGVAGKYESATATSNCSDSPFACTRDAQTGTVGHELGHAFGLPHPSDDGTQPGDPNYWLSTIMAVQWDFPTVLLIDSEINPEKSTLVQHPFFWLFYDVPPSQWALQWIESILGAGLTAGFPDGTYRPDNPVTRAEMAVFLKKGIHGSTYSPPTPDGSHPFSDISGHWAEAWIEDLFDEGFTSGFPDGTYRPDNQVTRAEMAVFLKKAIHGSAYTSPTPDGSHPFSDIAGHWAEAWIEDLYDEGITTGYPDGTYRPENQVTRAEMAVFLVNAFSLPLP
jgi:hypothetical protein